MRWLWKRRQGKELLQWKTDSIGNLAQTLWTNGKGIRQGWMHQHNKKEMQEARRHTCKRTQEIKLITAQTSRDNDSIDSEKTCTKISHLFQPMMHSTHVWNPAREWPGWAKIAPNQIWKQSLYGEHTYNEHSNLWTEVSFSFKKISWVWTHTICIDCSIGKEKH